MMVSLASGDNLLKQFLKKKKSEIKINVWAAVGLVYMSVMFMIHFVFIQTE